MNQQNNYANKISLPFYFNDFFQPGVYAIVNKKRNMYYIGEANNIAMRLSQHISQLSKKKHECELLQKDFSLYNKENFDFIILEISSIWFDRILRLQKEREYIKKYKSNCYNQILPNKNSKKRINTKNTRSNSIAVKINNQNFVSISEAARYFNISLSTVRLRLNNSSYKNWNYINNKKRLTTSLARAVVVNDNYYLSVSLAAAKECISERTVRKNIKTKSNWNFFDQLSETQKNKIKNLNEQICNAKQTTYKLGRSVQVGTTVFSSIRKTANSFLIDSHTVRKRINSINFPEWKWAD